MCGGCETMSGMRGVRAIKRKSTFFEEIVSKPGWLLYDIDSPFKGTAVNSQFIRDFIERYDKVHLTESEDFFTIHVPTNVFFQLPKQRTPKLTPDELLKFTKARLNGVTLIPPALKQRIVLYRHGKTEDTIRAVQNEIRNNYLQVMELAKTLKRDTVEATCRAVFRYVRITIPYKEDRPGYEEIKSCARTIADASEGIGSDCEDMTILVCSLLACLQVPTVLRVIGIESYTEPEHIYGVAIDKGRHTSYAVDTIPEVPAFDYEFTYLIKYKKDYPMEIHYLNGVRVGTGDGTTSLLSLMRDNYLSQATLLSYGYDNAAQAEPEVKEAARAALQRLLSRFELYGGDKRELIRAIEEGSKKTFDASALQGADGIARLMQVSDTEQISGIKDFLRGDKRISKAAHKINQVAFTAFRTAYLQLLKLNFRGHARRWAKAGGTVGTKLKNLWFNIGGDESKLMAAAREGMNRKPIFGDSKKGQVAGLGVVALAAVIAAAGTILVAVAPLLKQVPAPEPEAAMDEPAGAASDNAGTYNPTANERTRSQTIPATADNGNDTTNFRSMETGAETAKDSADNLPATTTTTTVTTAEEGKFKKWYNENKKGFWIGVAIFVVVVILIVGYVIYKRKKKGMSGVKRKRSRPTLGGVSLAGSRHRRPRAVTMRKYYALPAAHKPRKRRKRAA